MANQKALKNLLRKLRELQPYATETTLKCKLSQLKHSYHRELNRVRRSEKEASSSADIYEPKLWFFNELSFLGDPNEEVPKNNGEDENENENKPPTNNRSKHNISNDKVLDPTSLDKLFQKNKQLTKKFFENKCNFLDDANIFSATWAALYRKLHPEQQVFANKAIMDILYQGQLCRLKDRSAAKLVAEANSDDSFPSSYAGNDFITWKAQL